ncbi:pyrophosphatase PpaX [Sporosarcina sp. P37]|uniref:pyrophosphatase PpaX n=1 Tax=unclassified Sporosarcina TaxID=2647733 RepID=UPI0009BD5C07|nr:MULTISPECIES: pyrophosphatase PpaX [unclassified Sporosarcina]ARD47640.1 pyrophosphatase [Sporosarcina sp. P33]ARK24170.1 pyrophosphatase PpaX [Sporosarcina sp. P37]PID17411.1 pyrophosphatase PpaX [Sporosarcina sp. P35]
MTNQPITTLLFDFDGTLADTNELILSSFQHVLDHHFPGRFQREDMLPFIGPTLYDTFSSIAPDKTDQLIDEYRKWNIANHDAYITEFEGVTDTLRKLYDLGLKMAVVSTKKRDMVERGIGLLGIAPYFETVIGLDDITNPKPDPEPILLALERLGSTPEESLMIGDNFHDILGGQNAGVRTAAVAWALKGESYLQTFKPDYMLRYMSDLLKLTAGIKL